MEFSRCRRCFVPVMRTRSGDWVTDQPGEPPELMCRAGEDGQSNHDPDPNPPAEFAAAPLAEFDPDPLAEYHDQVACRECSGPMSLDEAEANGGVHFTHDWL